jgi:PPOX class probable F420-dependent enzyme
MTVLDEIGRGRYVSLTTYRKDGTGVDTPVWHVRDGDELFIVSNADAWKVKRIRNDGRVVVTVCGIRGTITPGAPSAPGTARLLDGAGTTAARALLARKYLMSRLGNWFTTVLHLPKKPVIGIAVTLSPSSGG